MPNISVSAEGLVDLHVHSTVSDGTCTPRELVELVKQRKMAGFALTDHDLINGLDEAQTLSVDLKEIVPTFSSAKVFLDGEPWNIRTVTTLDKSVECRPRGGFVYVISL